MKVGSIFQMSGESCLDGGYAIVLPTPSTGSTGASCACHKCDGVATPIRTLIKSDSYLMRLQAGSNVTDYALKTNEESMSLVLEKNGHISDYKS